MLILTGKAIDFAEEFIDRDEEYKRTYGEAATIELDEDAQIDLFQIMSMYERDKYYQSFIRGCNALYLISILAGPDCYRRMMDKFTEMMKEGDKKE